MKNKTRVYYDFEFIEGTQSKTFLGIPYSKTKFMLEPISVGMIKETGETYYAVFNDFNLKESWNRYDLKLPEEMGDEPIKVYWIRENVLKPIWEDYLKNQNVFEKTYFWNLTSEFFYKTMKLIIKWTGKSKEQIAKEIIEFLAPNSEGYFSDGLGSLAKNRLEDNPVELWGYMSSYDHVCLAQCFGKMINLPKGIPMLTYDLKQIMDEKQKELDLEFENIQYIEELSVSTKKDLKHFKTYPKQTNEHSAIHDATWNKQLHEFLKTLK